MTEESLLFRIIEERYVDDGRVGSLAFRPLEEKDQGLLSTYNGDLIGPEGAFVDFDIRSNSPALGVLALQVNECTTLGLQCREDPTEFREHAVVDMTQLSKGQQKKKSERLRDIAVGRSWQFRPS